MRTAPRACLAPVRGNLVASNPDREETYWCCLRNALGSFGRNGLVPIAGPSHCDRLLAHRSLRGPPNCSKAALSRERSSSRRGTFQRLTVAMTCGRERTEKAYLAAGRRFHHHTQLMSHAHAGLDTALGTSTVSTSVGSMGSVAGQTRGSERRACMKQLLRGLSCLFIGAVVSSAVAEPAAAHDDANTTRYGIVDTGDNFAPFGTSDDGANGFRVFLSSPRHADSGSRGECMNPGRQENVNGRQWNWMAANGNYFGGVYSPSSHGRNIHGRGYNVRVSRNSKDNGYLDTITNSQNYGSHVHVVTHTNANGGCGNAASYFLAMYRGGHANDQGLAQRFYNNMRNVAPGGENIGTDTTWTGGTLAELGRNAPYGDAYIELAFHTNQPAQSWVYYETDPNSWNYGVAIDEHLGYP